MQILKCLCTYKTETGALSLSLATRTGWCGRSGGRNPLMLQIWALVSWSYWRNGFWRVRYWSRCIKHNVNMKTNDYSFFMLFDQVDSLSVNPSPEGLPELMVSQPGCGYAILMCSWTRRALQDLGMKTQHLLAGENITMRINVKAVLNNSEQNCLLEYLSLCMCKQGGSFQRRRPSSDLWTHP